MNIVKYTCFFCIWKAFYYTYSRHRFLLYVSFTVRAYVNSHLIFEIVWFPTFLPFWNEKLYLIWRIYMKVFVMHIQYLKYILLMYIVCMVAVYYCITVWRIFREWATIDEELFVKICMYIVYYTYFIKYISNYKIYLFTLY